jgi:GLPGLI family protein
MKKYKQLIFILMGFGFLKANAQNSIFLSQGRIEYEKKINLFAQIDDETDEAWRDLMKKTRPHFMTNYFDLKFNKQLTLFMPGRENVDNNRTWQPPANDNIVFIDLNQKNYVAQKTIFGETFLVNDSARKIKWKITDETRNIVGFNCRRANGIIMDSIYIVAYYTDEILTTGGPECFNSLPGMILGLAIPHEHVTWFATKVYAEDIPTASLTAPTKGKKTTNAGLLSTLKEALKDWGKWGDRYIKGIML